MKSFFSILLAISLLISGNILLTSCSTEDGYVSSKDDDDNKTSKKNNKSNDTDEQETENNTLAPGKSKDTETISREKIAGELEFVTEFSDGIALANTTENPNTICINKDGEIVFELDKKIDNRKMYERFFCNTSFVNGLFLLPDGSICDDKGNITYPLDFGYEEFYDVAFDANLILAKKVEATYDSTKVTYELLKTNFEKVYSTDLQLSAPNQYCNFVDCYLFMEIEHAPNDDKYRYWNTITGEITSIEPADIPSEYWMLQFGNYMLPNSKYALKESDIAENVLSIGKFYNGIAPVTYYNMQSNKTFFNYIYDNGTFIYEPIDIGTGKLCIFDNDSEIALIGADSNGLQLSLSSYDETLKVYNTSGELTNEININDFDNSDLSWYPSTNNGIINVIGKKGNNSYNFKTLLFDTNGNKLF